MLISLRIVHVCDDFGRSGGFPTAENRFSDRSWAVRKPPLLWLRLCRGVTQGICFLIACGAALGAQTATRLPPAVVPGENWRTLTAVELGFDERKLATGLAAFSSNVVIVRRGYLCTTTRGDISASIKLYSVGKSITALVFGAVLQHERADSATGKSPLRGGATCPSPTLDTLVDGSDFPVPPKASYRQFMSMTSDYGLTPHEPGKHYAYNNEAVQFYGRHMDTTFFNKIGPAAVLQKVFWDKIGRQDEASFIGYWSGWDGGFSLSARDCARLGLLVQRRGEWNGRQILPASFVDALYTDQIASDATENTSTGQQTSISNNRWNQQRISPRLREGYSFGFWLVRGAKLGANEAIAASGLGGNYIIVVPRHEMVIAVTNSDITPPQLRPWQYLDAVVDALVPVLSGN